MWLMHIMGCGQSKHGKHDHNSSNTSIHSGTNGSAKRKKSKHDKVQNHLNDHQTKEGIGNHSNNTIDAETNSFKALQKYKNNSKDNSGPVMSGPRITDSQIEFFRILDEKIEKGKVLSKEDSASYS